MTNMAKSEKKKPDSPPMEEECDYMTRARKRTRKKFLRHGMVSRKAKQLQKTRFHPESLDAENYDYTEDEDITTTIYRSYLNMFTISTRKVWSQILRTISGMAEKIQVTGEKFDARGLRGRILSCQGH